MSHGFNNILDEVRGCTLCASHLPLPPKPIVQLHPKAKILIAGQAPGKKVADTGIPFDDPSGKRLRKWMGVESAQFYNAEQIISVSIERYNGQETYAAYLVLKEV